MSFWAKLDLQYIDGLNVPSFLRLTTEQRNAAWEASPPVRPATHWIDPRIEADRVLREQQKKEKTRLRIAKLLATKQRKLSSPTYVRGMRWDMRHGKWVPNQQEERMNGNGDKDSSEALPATPATPDQPAETKVEEAKMARKVKRAKKSRANGADSKTNTVAKLLKRSGGCTLAEVLKATGWPAVSIPAIAKAAKLKLRKEKVKGKPTQYFGS